MSWRKAEQNHEDAVSPVIGVMLLLVVTIIIAAVVSGFAGNIAGSTAKAPTLAATANLEITGDKDSRLYVRVDSVSEPIPTKDLRIVTSWSKDVGGKIVRGGNTSYAGKSVTSYYSAEKHVNECHPVGYGPGVEKWKTYGTLDVSQHFGNYTLEAGTTFRASPYRSRPASDHLADDRGGYGPRLDTETGSVVGELYEYYDGANYKIGECIDSMQSILGGNWNELRPGDVVNLKIMHTPSGKVIYDRDIVATGRSFL